MFRLGGGGGDIITYDFLLLLVDTNEYNTAMEFIM